MLNLIKGRRMTRNFKETPLSSEIAQELIDAARFAPRAGNAEGIRYLLLQGDSVKHYWDVTLKGEDREQFPWPGLLKAPTLIIIWTNSDDYLNRYSEIDKQSTGLGKNEKAWGTPYWWVDGGMAAMTILIGAESKNLGSLFFGLFGKEDAVKARFDVPDRYKAVGAIAIGHAAEQQRRSQSTSRRRMTIEELIFEP